VATTSSARRCQAPGCEKSIPRGRYCSNHYRHLQQYGRILTREEALANGRRLRREANPPKQCSVKGCEQMAAARGWCLRHYARWQRHGSPLANKHTGRRAEGRGYVTLKLPLHPRAGVSGYVREHDLIMERHIGRLIKPHEVVHHIDGDVSNNSLGNLALMTRSQHASYHLWIRWGQPWESEVILRAALWYQLRTALEVV